MPKSLAGLAASYSLSLPRGLQDVRVAAGLSAAGGLEAVPAGGGGGGASSLSSAFSDITATSPATTSSESGDRTVTFTGGGSRTINGSSPGSGVLQYRVDSGSWLTYSAFTVTSGQTIGFRVNEIESNAATTITVTDASRGATLGTFNYTATGY